MNLQEKIIDLQQSNIVSLLGHNDSLLELIEKRFASSIVVRGNNLILRGLATEITLIESIMKELLYLLGRNGALTEEDVNMVLNFMDNSESKTEEIPTTEVLNAVIYNGAKDKVRIKTPKQHEYFSKVLRNDIVFAIGPAGTGKTFLAVAMALAALKRNDVGRIILSRPAVEAGESLGFLPGDLNEKIDPYLRPITDALQFMLTSEKLKTLREKNIIEINPLAYMRGRTLSNSFILLDEAQNATASQMKMFLTRLGPGSKAIITGDLTQVDLPEKKKSGLLEANKILGNINGIDFVYFDNSDVVRHRLVADIIKAYETLDEKKEDYRRNNK